jgi:hypothetical protein
MYLDFAKQSFQSEFGRDALQVSNIAISDTQRCTIDVVDEKPEVIDFNWRRYCVGQLARVGFS